MTLNVFIRGDQFSKISAKRQIQILENCNYAVELAKKLNFVIVNIEGNDIMTGNKTLTLGLGKAKAPLFLLKLRRQAFFVRGKIQNKPEPPIIKICTP